MGTINIAIRTEVKEKSGYTHYQDTGACTVDESELRIVESDANGVIVEFERDNQTIRAFCTFTSRGAIWEIWRHLPAPQEEAF